MKTVVRYMLAVCLCVAISSYAYAQVQSKDAPRRDKLIEKHFGKKIHDPYRWMENPHDPDLVDWVESENNKTKSYLSGDLYDEIYQEINQIFQDVRLQAIADREMTQLMRQQNVLTTVQRFRPVVRENIITPRISFSPDRQYKIRFSSDSGSDLQRLEIIKIESDEMLPDVLMVIGDQVIWEKDDASFIYVTGRDGRLADYRSAIFRHVIGTRQPNDQLIYVEQERGIHIFLVELEGRYFLLRGNDDSGGISEINLQTGNITEIIPPIAGLRMPFDLSLEGDRVYAVKYGASPMGSIVSVDIRSGEVETVLPEQSKAIQNAMAYDDDIYVTLLDDTVSTLIRYHCDTGEVENIQLPSQGSATLFIYDENSLALYISSYSEPGRYWVFNAQTQRWDLLFTEPPLEFELDSFRTYYTAHNGQKVPIWVVKAKDTELTPDTPVRLYGYGGFCMNLLPYTDRYSMPWYKRGGVSAYVTLPGGLEYGERWHQAGMLHNKRNVFRDYAAAAEHLIDTGYTNPSRIVACGASNGGLLVAATMNRYPHLFAAGVPEVGVLDLTRYQLFTSGKWWVTEFGDRNNKRDFSNLYAISPYHNVEYKDYPAMFVMTADFDDRVVPAHSYKYAARLKHRNLSDKPILLHSKRWGSHIGYGNTALHLEQVALRWTFMIKALGMDESEKIRGN